MSINALEKSKAYQGIKKQICQRVVSEWQPNHRLPPIKELAGDLGAGQSSTYQAVKELVQEGILVSKPRLGTFVNNNMTTLKPKLEMVLRDKPFAMKGPLSGKKVQLLTYQSIYQRHTFFTEAISSFNKTITKAGGEIITTFIDDSFTSNMKPFLKTEAQGIVAVNPSTLLHMTCLPNQVLTAITPSSECTMAMTERFDLIAVDDIQGSTIAGEYLRNMGYQNACFLGVASPVDSNRYDKISSKRLEGLALGIKSPVQPEWQLSCNAYVSFDAARCVQNWIKLNPRPEAIFAASDDLAYGFIHGAIVYGLHPGRDFQIIGFDAQFKGTYSGDWTLTSVAIPISEMGAVGAKTLINRLDDPNTTPQRLYLGCKLFEGNSVTKKA